MKLNDMATEAVGYVQPSLDGVKLRLAALPSLEKIESEKSPVGFFERIVFNFKEYNGDAEFNTNMFSPYTFDREQYDKGVIENKGKKRADTEAGKYVNMVNNNFGRLMHLFGCFMTKENYEILQDTDIEDAEEFLATAEKLYDKDLFDIEFTSMIGYVGKYVQWPKFGDCLSSKHKEKPLVFKEDSKYFTLHSTVSSPDSESRGAASVPRARNSNNI